MSDGVYFENQSWLHGQADEIRDRGTTSWIEPLLIERFDFVRLKDVVYPKDYGEFLIHFK